MSGASLAEIAEILGHRTYAMVKNTKNKMHQKTS
jgi:hypothetical protein